MTRPDKVPPKCGLSDDDLNLIQASAMIERPHPDFYRQVACAIGELIRYRRAMRRPRHRSLGKSSKIWDSMSQ